MQDMCMYNPSVLLCGLPLCGLTWIGAVMSLFAAELITLILTYTKAQLNVFDFLPIYLIVVPSNYSGLPQRLLSHCSPPDAFFR